MSIWLGPPTMNRKMTDLALPGKCGGFGGERIHALQPPRRRVEQRRQRERAEAVRRADQNVAARAPAGRMMDDQRHGT